MVAPDSGCTSCHVKLSVMKAKKGLIKKQKSQLIGQVQDLLCSTLRNVKTSPSQSFCCFL